MKKNTLLFLLLMTSIFTLSACEEDNFEREEPLPIYQDPSYHEGEITSDEGGNVPNPAPDDYLQRIVKVDYFMDQVGSKLSMQGATIYGDYLFQFVSGNAEIFVYNMKTKEYLGSIKGESNGRWHNNQAIFSGIFYEEDDEFPILYTSQIHAQEQSVQAWRVKRTADLFQLELVQKIKFPYYNDYNFLANINIVIDEKSEFFWLYSRDYNSQMGQISKWKVPDPHVNEVLYKEEDKLDFFYPALSFTYAQGGMMIGHRIYFVQGVPGRSDLQLQVINVNTQMVSSFNLRDYGLGIEPEGLSFYEGRFICTSNRKGIYEIYLNGY